MSLALFTDSTTAQVSPAFTERLSAGNSTNATSESSCWAWSVMPTVPMSPLTRTHSCEAAYFKSEGTFAIKLEELRQGGWVWSISFSVKRFGRGDRRGLLAADLDLDGGAGLGELGFHVAHADADAERWAVRAAHNFADGRGAGTGAPDRI